MFDFVVDVKVYNYLQMRVLNFVSPICVAMLSHKPLITIQ